MALDLHDEKNNELLYQIDDIKFEALSNVFETVKQQTGIEIDQYRDCKLMYTNRIALNMSNRKVSNHSYK
jgi:hypothetical protein